MNGNASSLANVGDGRTRAAGITLSPKQVERAGQLAAQRGLANVDFRVMNALAMEFPDDSFDLVWACESGEHMPDKKAYVQEMVRVLKPGENPLAAPHAHTPCSTPMWAFACMRHIFHRRLAPCTSATCAVQQAEAVCWFRCS